MTSASATPTITPFSWREPTKTLREKATDRFHAALAGVLAAGIEDALAAGDHARAVSLINRGFAEGSPELGCELLYQAIAVVGAARTWTVQIAPQTQVPHRPRPTA
ncbi:hypothetical protein QLQ12_45525 [Actinoplanes sp. NEAU-A12]|uniref:Uncharacterized protein n=1 Tax=Actinoplanes sandaracinus TaxID=3045177 RepID=A0ABT6X1G9_9ACTN|nr:hypothetical protein [Actinoplanes sandaracinus]MDI6105856.1 hypothetical protein [Actinoplanes sandaracinus]